MCYYYLFCQLRRKFNANDRSGGRAFFSGFVLFQKATNQPKLTAMCFKKRRIAAKELNKF